MRKEHSTTTRATDADTTMNRDDASMQASPNDSFLALFRIIETLRGPNGCSWDREQTTSSLRDSLIEECYECVEAVSDLDADRIREELGDVFLVATMMSYIEQQKGSFSISDVFDEVSAKLVRRHPHVFGESEVSTSDEVIIQWENIKTKERQDAGEPSHDSVLDRVSGALAPLRLAWELQKKAAKAGFDWPQRGMILEKLSEELDELSEAESLPDEDAKQRAVEEEIGDILFTVVNLSRSYSIEPDIALQRANTKFGRRFREVERGMRSKGLTMNASNLEAMDAIWNEYKQRLQERTKS